MTVRVAINGFGRIGRLVLRSIVEHGRTDIEVVAINDLGPVETNAHLLRYDSVHGRFPGTVTVDGDSIDVGHGKIKVTAIRDPKDLPHKDLGVDIALECTGLFTSKEKFALFDRSWPVIDRYAVDLDNPDLVDLVVADLADQQRTFTFLHLSAPDVAGHAHGWMSPSYLDAVREVDRLLGELLDAVDHAGPSIAVVLTADHGGQGPGHGDATVPADYTVPFFVRAPGVPGGTDLYDLNPQLRDPGTARPSYDGPQPVRNGDLANLVTDLLGLPAVPGSTLDAAQDLEVVP